MNKAIALRLLAALAVAGLLLGFAGPGLRAGFTNDDLMNTYRAWRPPATDHVRDTVMFWRHSDSYRPAGSLFYRVLFESFGLNPLPYRIACYGLLLLNLWLAYAVLRRLADAGTGAVAVLLLAYHGQFWGFYRNTGMCYDLLCFFFYTGALLYYLRSRERQFPLTWPRVAVWAGLYVLCLNSKEMAVTLPVVILAYELMAAPPEWRRPWGWLWRAGRVPLVGAAMTALFIAGRIAAPLGLPSMGAYRPEPGLMIYLDHAYHFLGHTLYQPKWLTPVAAGMLLAVMLGAAVLWRSLPFRLGVVWALVGILPVAFIPQRGLDMAYAALPGFALAIAAVVSALARRIRLRPAAAFAVVLAAMVFVHSRYGRLDFDALLAEGRHIDAVYREFRARQQVPFPPHCRILFLRDPFPDADWNSTFLAYLTSGDRTLYVQRADRLVKERPADPVDFDAVLTWQKDGLRECDAARFRGVRAADLLSIECGARP